MTPDAPGGVDQPRVGICGIAIESSTFSPHRSHVADFERREGQELLRRYPFLEEGAPLRGAAAWRPLFHARALPGGAVTREAYEQMSGRLLQLLAEEVDRDGPLDGLYLDLHGAMSVEGMSDAEGRLCQQIRRVTGPDTLLSASMDLHGNVSRALAEAVDMLTCYRMAPHEDAWNTRERAVHNLLVRLRGPHGRDPERRRPHVAWRQVPVLLPGEKTSTRVEPARGLYGRIPEVEAQDGVVDAAIWVGYAWADEPRCQAAVVVMGDDPDVALRECRDLAERYWRARTEFRFVGPTASFREALARATAPGAPRPFVLSDSGDNPTAGGAGDVTWSLAQLLESDRAGLLDGHVVHASVFDPAATELLTQAGVGAEVTVTVGARVDSGPHGPVELNGVITAIDPDDPVAGTAVVVRTGHVSAVITERRKPYHHRHDFTRLGLDVDSVDILVVKIGYLEPELHDLAAGWILCLTPGGVDQDLLRLGHRNLQPGVHPFEPADGEPDLTPELIR